AVLLIEEASARNSVNRSKLSMPHFTGSKPIREIIYELGGKDGNPPDMTAIIFETRKKEKKCIEPETIAKYVEIQELVQSEPSLTNIDIVALLEELKATRKEKESLQERMDILESKYERLESLVVRQPSSPPSDQEFEV
ncbi:hypothetical protein HAX54_041717, partial [Datura stramonium]|nr:hypothetical protein [Datura stramonium]